MFVTFINISFSCDISSILYIIEILVLTSWIPASKNFIFNLYPDLFGNTTLTNLTYRKKIMFFLRILPTHDGDKAQEEQELKKGISLSHFIESKKKH